MSKMIKFNLTLNKSPVRDLDDLRENFNIDDLLDVYHRKVLHRWLDVRGLSTQLDNLMKIKSLDNKIIATELCQIFHADVTPEDIDAAVYPFTVRQQQKEQLAQLASYNFSRNSVIDDYHNGYNNLCTEIREKSEDYQFLKSAVDNLWKNYSNLLKVNLEAFFLSFAKHPLVFFAMLANKHYREPPIFDLKHKSTILSLIPPTLIREERYEDAIQYNQNTFGRWKELTNDTVVIKEIKNPFGSVKIGNKFGKEYSGSDKDVIGKRMEGLKFISTQTNDSVTYARIINVNVKTKLPIYYLSYSGLTAGYWKDVVPKGKMCLILRMDEGDFIRNAGVNNEELSAKDVNGSFLILSGIDYKSNYADHTLIYIVI